MSHAIPQQAAGKLAISKPGVYEVPEVDYHRDPVAGGSISATSLKHLIPPNTPAHFNEWRRRPHQPSAAMVYGSAWHSVVLGAGPEVVAFPRHNASTKAGKAIRADMRAAEAEGKIALLQHDFDAIHAMHLVLRRHPQAKHLLDPERGKAEQTMVWQDEETGIWCRALVDFLRKPEPDGRLILVDNKSADSAHQDAWGRKAWDYGYPIQRDQYVEGAEALGLGDPVDFLFVVQEKDPPYLVNVIDLDVDAVQIGKHMRRAALRTYAECAAKNEWPGYPPDIATAPTPGYISYRYIDGEPVTAEEMDLSWT